MTTTTPRRRRRWPWVVLGSVVLAVVVLMLSVDAIASWQMKKTLATFEGYTFDFKRIHVSPLKLGVVITDLKMMKDSAGGSDEPFFFAKKFQMSVYSHRLSQRFFVARVEVDEPQVNLILSKNKTRQQLNMETPDFLGKLKAALPIPVDRVEIKKAQLVLIDRTEKSEPKFWAHDIDGVIENMAIVPAIKDKSPTTVSLAGTVQKTGQLTVFVTLDPEEKGMTFAGRAQIKGLQLAEFYDLMTTKTGLHLERGVLDVSAELVSKDGIITGTVKPLITDAKVVAGRPGADKYLQAAFADGAINLIAADNDGHRQLGTVVPLSGKVTNPQAELATTITGALKSAFLIGVGAGINALPAPAAASEAPAVAPPAPAKTAKKGKS